MCVTNGDVCLTISMSGRHCMRRPLIVQYVLLRSTVSNYGHDYKVWRNRPILSQNWETSVSGFITNGTLRENCTKFTTESSDLTKPSVSYNIQYIQYTIYNIQYTIYNIQFISPKDLHIWMYIFVFDKIGLSAHIEHENAFLVYEI